MENEKNKIAVTIVADREWDYDPKRDGYGNYKFTPTEYTFNIEAEDRDDAVRKICKDETSANLMINGSIHYGRKKQKYAVWYGSSCRPATVRNRLSIHQKFHFSEWFEDLCRKHLKKMGIGLNKDLIFPPKEEDPDFYHNGLEKVYVKAKADTGKWTQLLEDQKNEIAFVEKIVNFDSKVTNICTRLYESFGVDFDINEEGEVTLKAADNCVNESQSLLDAKEYVKSHLDDDEYTNILFI